MDTRSRKCRSRCGRLTHSLTGPTIDRLPRECTQSKGNHCPSIDLEDYNPSHAYGVQADTKVTVAIIPHPSSLTLHPTLRVRSGHMLTTNPPDLFARELKRHGVCTVTAAFFGRFPSCSRLLGPEWQTALARHRVSADSGRLQSQPAPENPQGTKPHPSHLVRKGGCHEYGPAQLDEVNEAISRLTVRAASPSSAYPP